MRTTGLSHTSIGEGEKGVCEASNEERKEKEK